MCLCQTDWHSCHNNAMELVDVGEKAIWGLGGNRENLKVEFKVLAKMLIGWHVQHGKPLFHPNEGHPDAYGNIIVDNILQWVDLH